MSTWLTTLRNIELHRLAVLLGTPCSGTKAVRIKGIENALLQTRTALVGTNNVKAQKGHDVRLLSIDMGVKNLAYAYLTTQHSTTTTATTIVNSTSGSKFLPSSSFVLQEWQKFDISVSADDGPDLLAADDPENAKAAHAYHPAIYARRAYQFVQSILKYDPTHIIIERQRFRSAGGPAVQEWSIRVGVFEAMLWTVLRTLIEQSALNSENASDRLSLDVEGILPARVNRFWFDQETIGKPALIGVIDQVSAGKLSGRDMKKAKIKLVTSLLQMAGKESTTDSRPFEIGTAQQVQDQISSFQGDGNGSKTVAKVKSDSARSGRQNESKEALSASKITKLDDLADCLLQGLAWLNWRNNRIKIIEQGQDAFDLR